MTDATIIESLSESVKNEFIEQIVESSDVIYESLYGFTASTISEWYKMFVASDEFQGFSREHKRLSFEQYELLIVFLKNIDDFMTKNKLGEYNQN